MLKVRIAAVLVASVVAFSGCSASATNFKEAAEKVITSDKGLGAGSKATCDKPADTKVGTTFDCVGTTKDGVEIPLLATITDSKTVTVTQPDAAGTTDTTPVAEDTTPATATT